MDKKNKTPVDLNQLASFIIEQATGKSPVGESKTKNQAAVALGRLGGLKGGHARAKNLSSSRRKQIAKKAAEARWSKKK